MTIGRKRRRTGCVILESSALAASSRLALKHLLFPEEKERCGAFTFCFWGGKALNVSKLAKAMFNDFIFSLFCSRLVENPLTILAFYYCFTIVFIDWLHSNRKPRLFSNSHCRKAQAAWERKGLSQEKIQHAFNATSSKMWVKFRLILLLTIIKLGKDSDINLTFLIDLIYEYRAS